MTVTELARQAIKTYLETGQPLPVPARLSPELSQRAGAFVSLHYPDGELRGCIGTTAPTTPDLAAEVIANAVAAATRDDRFDPVTAGELPQLELSVDVLGPAVSEPDRSKLNPKTFGLIVSTPDGRAGVLLPDLDNVTTVSEQIAVCREKGGIAPDEPVEMRKFQVTRYKEQPQPVPSQSA